MIYDQDGILTKPSPTNPSPTNPIPDKAYNWHPTAVTTCYKDMFTLYTLYLLSRLTACGLLHTYNLYY